jgi:hypothetical protein
MSFNKLFLPVGLITGIVLAVCLPAPGVWLKSAGLIPFFVAAIVHKKK